MVRPAAARAPAATLTVATLTAALLFCGCQSEIVQESTYSLPSEQSDSTILDSRLKTLNDEVVKYPKRDDLYYRIAGVHFMKSDFKNSAVALQHAISLSPDSMKYHYQLGRVYLQMAEFEPAEEEFRDAVRLTSVDRYTGARSALGYTLWKRGKLKEAVAQFERCAQIEPGKPEFHYFLGSLYDVLGEGEKTIENYLEYLALGGRVYRKRVMFVLGKRGVDTTEIERLRRAETGLRDEIGTPGEGDSGAASDETLSGVVDDVDLLIPMESENPADEASSRGR